MRRTPSRRPRARSPAPPCWAGSRSGANGSSRRTAAASCRRSCRPACAPSRSPSTPAARPRPAASSCPNDRVDVIRTYRDDESSRRRRRRRRTLSETILANIRVLAIGQNVQERNGEKVVTGETATLELTPAPSRGRDPRAEDRAALAGVAQPRRRQPATRRAKSRADQALTVVRYGVVASRSRRGDAPRQKARQETASPDEIATSLTGRRSRRPANRPGVPVAA